MTVRTGDVVIASTRCALRVLETASPPTFYLPLADVAPGVLVPAPGTSWCEWKGEAHYWSVRTPAGLIVAAGWSYPHAHATFAAIRDHVAFYPSRLECTVDGECAWAQAGGYYGGWITAEIVGPFKGEPGTAGW